MANFKTNPFAKAYKAKNEKLHGDDKEATKVVKKSRGMMEKALGKKKMCKDCGNLACNCQ